MKPRPAATVVLARDATDEIELLLLLRNSKLVFHGGHWVFPGGRIDPADYPAGQAAPDVEHLAARNAAVRETREEAGLNICADELVHIAHWTTPEGYPRRFSTWFFACVLSDPEAIVVDQDEILDYAWMSPGRALAAHKNGDLTLPQPTFQTLRSLAHYRSLDELRKGLTNIVVHVFPPDSDHYPGAGGRRNCKPGAAPLTNAKSQ